MEDFEGVYKEVRERLRALSLNPPRYEGSWYGPLDKYFACIFSGRHWMVKPQPPLREESADDADSVASFSSYGNPVKGRAKYPDFGITKYTSSPNDDTLHIVVEVKRRGDDIAQADSATLRYLDMAPNVVAHAMGMAIAGDVVHIYTLHRPEGGDMADVDDPTVDMQVFDLNSTELITFLVNYRRDND